VNANPGIKKINSNPEIARKRKRRVSTIAKESPDNIWYISEFILVGILHKEILCYMKREEVVLIFLKNTKL